VHPNPYAAPLDGRDALAALAETPGRIDALTRDWTDALFERRLAPGKWSARLILIHLTQSELAFSLRTRYALADANYVAQPFSQDDWLVHESHTPARVALAAYLAFRRFNLAMWTALTPAERERRFTHPEYGELSVQWVLEQAAGHELHHLRQLEALG
jgi:DinB superfamily